MCFIRMHYNILHIKYIFFIPGCPPGYYEINCSRSCRFPNYGIRCQQECVCSKELMSSYYWMSSHKYSSSHFSSKYAHTELSNIGYGHVFSTTETYIYVIRNNIGKKKKWVNVHARVLNTQRNSKPVISFLIYIYYM